ncbi:MAG: hypothetical protein AABX82_05210, partial [Nanoarchaeota archaeon]
VSNGGGNFRGQLGVQNYTSATIPAFTINSGFNISGADEAVRTNGTVTILNTDADDALNISDAARIGGPFRIGGNPTAPVFAVGHAGPGLVTITGTDPDDVLNLTAGGLVARGQLSVQNYTAAGPAFTVNMGFNVSGANSALSTNGTVTIAGLTTVTNTDPDDALNITGGSRFGGATQYNDRVTIDSNGQIVVRSGDADDALNVSAGFTAAGGAASDSAFRVADTGKVRVQNNDANDALNVSAGGFTAAGSAASDGAFRVDDAGAVIVRNPDADDAFNVSFGFTAGGSAINDGAFRIASTGKVRVQNNDADDALNISTGGFFVNGTVNIGSRIAGEAQHSLTINAPSGANTNRCAYLALQDEAGASWFIWVNTTGGFRTGSTAPISCDGEGSSIGSQP